MKVLSLFTHPQVVPNLYEFLSSAENKIKYFEDTDFHRMENGNCLVTDILQNIFFCAQQKKEMYTGLEQLFILG